MRKIYSTLLLVFYFLSGLVAQEKSKDTTNRDQKFYFPVSFYSSPEMLAKQISGLAEKVLAVYTEKNKSKYNQNGYAYNILAGNYKLAIDMIDSVQYKKDDKSWGLYQKVYAFAKDKDKAEGSVFKGTIQKKFPDEFAKLSFSQKVNIAGMDSLAISKWIDKSYTDLVEELKKKATDSIDLKDARRFVTTGVTT